MQGSYAIRENYQHRLENDFFDDTPLKDEWQREVYELARQLADERRASTIVDVGCGSAFKLIKYLGHFHTIGLDLEPTLDFLRKTYPDRDWRESDFLSKLEPVDLVICSDVIEHIPDPDLLMSFLQRIPSPIYLISTPEREAVYGHDHSGPPSNTAHCREWTSAEFCAYASQWFDVRDALITNHEQGTQLVVCTAKKEEGRRPKPFWKIFSR